MSIKVFEVKLANPAVYLYYPGDTIQGHISLVVTPETDLGEGITITLFGLGHIQWTQSLGSTVIVLGGDDEFFRISTVQPAYTEQTEYPFALKIPDIPALPWTTTTAVGHIKYGIEAVVKTPWNKQKEQKVEHNFTIRSQVHPSLVLVSRNQTYFASTKTSESSTAKTRLCCFPMCHRNEAVKITFKTDSLWAYPGSDLEYSLEVDNTFSRRQVKSIKMELVGTWLHRPKYARTTEDEDDTRGREEMKVWWEVIVPIEGVPGLCTTSRGKVKLAPNLFPTQVECNVLRLTYKLRAYLDEVSRFRLFRSSTMTEVDVVVGS